MEGKTVDFSMWLLTGDKKPFLKAVTTISNKSCLQNRVGVRPKYAQDEAKKCDIIMLCLVNGKAEAFILANYENKPTPSIYISVICGAPGTGGILLDKFLAFADSENEDVSLSAVPSVLGYYPKPRFGFEFRKSCNLHSPKISAANVVGKKPEADLEKDKTFGEFLTLLQDRGFNVTKRGKCKDKTLSLKDIVDNFCDEDGYTMFRCTRKHVLRRSERVANK
jgi:hypothetical protein